LRIVVVMGRRGGDDDFDLDFGDLDQTQGAPRPSPPSDDEPDWDFGEVVDGPPTQPIESEDFVSEPVSGPDADDADDFDFDFDPDITDPSVRPVRIEPLKILTVCTHNRTRSVMSMAMLQAGFDRVLGPDAVQVKSLGFGPEGVAAIDDAIDAMKRRSLDVSEHRSRTVTPERLAVADLVLTSEKDHVVKIAAMSSDAFRKTFTLPEFCEKVLLNPAEDYATVEEWILSLSSSRVPAEYLSGDVLEVEDPTGSPTRQFEAATVGIERLCMVVTDAVGQALS
jgi:protein-tyrosine-phosphatase